MGRMGFPELRPKNSGSQYFTYLQKFSLVLMAIVGPDFRQCHLIFYPVSDCLYNLVSSCLIKLGNPSQAQSELLLKCFLESDINHELKRRSKMITTLCRHAKHKPNCSPLSLLPRDTRENAACCVIENTATVPLSRGGILQYTYV
jgi:hypothetical protein